MSLRNKESLEKFFAESRERMAKKKTREKERKKNELLKGPLSTTADSDRMVKTILRTVKANEDWSSCCDVIDIEMNSVDIISALSDKKRLNPSEKRLLDDAFKLAYPNEFDF